MEQRLRSFSNYRTLVPGDKNPPKFAQQSSPVSLEVSHCVVLAPLWLSFPVGFSSVVDGRAPKIN